MIKNIKHEFAAMHLKEQLYGYCLEYIRSGLAAAQQTIADAQEAARNETKSSAGDKYETAREMMQQEINMASQRITDLQKLKATLEMIDSKQVSNRVHPGSLVITSQGNYYIAISMGKVVIDNTTIYILSAASPLGSKLVGAGNGDTVSFNGKDIVIKEVL